MIRQDRGEYRRIYKFKYGDFAVFGRLLAAEAKIREMENAKVEKAPGKGTGDVTSAMSLVVAPDGFSYVKMQPGKA